MTGRLVYNLHNLRSDPAFLTTNIVMFPNLRGCKPYFINKEKSITKHKNNHRNCELNAMKASIHRTLMVYSDDSYAGISLLLSWRTCLDIAQFHYLSRFYVPKLKGLRILLPRKKGVLLKKLHYTPGKWNHTGEER